MGFPKKPGITHLTEHHPLNPAMGLLDPGTRYLRLQGRFTITTVAVLEVVAGCANGARIASRSFLGRLARSWRCCRSIRRLSPGWPYRG